MSGRERQSYRGNGFAIDLPEGWKDTTIHTLEGPVEDGIQHNILITAEMDLPFESAAEYAESQLGGLETELKSYRLLERSAVTLQNGLPAYRLVFCWQPTEGSPIYQHQLYVVVNGTGYKLTATFSKKTHKTLGPKVQRILLSFRPE